MGYVSLTESIKERMIESLTHYQERMSRRHAKSPHDAESKSSINESSIKDIVDRLFEQALSPYLDALTDPKIDLASEVAKARQHNRRLRDEVDRERAMREACEARNEKLRAEFAEIRRENKELSKAKKELNQIIRSGSLGGYFEQLLGESSNISKHKKL
jgi:DNA repair exonuclease SbcCD ATPase subunit